MKRLTAMSLVVLFITVIFALAGDRGPQNVTASLPLGAGAITPPTGDTGRFTPEFIVFAAAAGETQTVSVVIGSVTNTIGTKVIAAGDKIMTITNVPPLFYGNTIRISSSHTAVTNSAVLIGRLFD